MLDKIKKVFCSPTKMTITLNNGKVLSSDREKGVNPIISGLLLENLPSEKPIKPVK